MPVDIVAFIALKEYISKVGLYSIVLSHVLVHNPLQKTIQAWGFSSILKTKMGWGSRL